MRSLNFSFRPLAACPRLVSDGDGESPSSAGVGAPQMATRSAKLGGSAGAVLDYLKDDERVLDYYADDEDGLAFKTVWGNLGRELGLEAGVTREQWSELFEGHWNGEQVTKTGYRKSIDPETGEAVITSGVRTPMIDIVFAVPKGVSELYARAATQEQADAIGAAVFAAAQLAWTEGVQNHARVARVRTQDGSVGTHVQERVLADLLCTPALQFTARPTQDTVDRGAPADPHIHVHCATFTASQVGGKWYTIDEAGIKRTAEYRDQLFMGELARQMELLGHEMDYVDFDSSRSGRVTFEPKASDAGLRTFWSSNHERTFGLARTFEAKYGRPPTDQEMANLMKVSRGKKAEKEMDARPTRSRWIDDAREQGYEARDVSPHDLRHSSLAAREAELYRRLMAPKGLVREDATFTGDTIRPALVRCAVGLGMSWEEINDYETKIREQLVSLRPASEDRFSLYTTKVQLAKERFITDRRAELAATALLRVSQADIAAAIAAQPLVLDREQRSAVTAACPSSGWVHISGEAGSGKTTTSKVIVDAHRRADPTVQVVAVSVAAKVAADYAKKLETPLYG